MNDVEMAERTDVHELIVLSRGSLELGVVPTIGGALSHFDEYLPTGARRHWFRPAKAEDIASGNVLGMAHFPLVPVSGRIAGGVLQVGGEPFFLPKNDIDTGLNYLHGEGWHARWNVTEKRSSFVRMELKGPVAGWPFRYLAWQEVELLDDGLRLTLGLRNEDERRWPAGLGTHPWFSAPKASLKAEVDQVWYTNETLLFDRVERVPEQWNFNQGRSLEKSHLVNGFGGWDGIAELTWSNGMHMRLEADGVLAQHLMIFTLHPSGAWCIEPVSHVVDGFNLAEKSGRQDTGTVMLEPGAEMRGSVMFRIVS